MTDLKMGLFFGFMAGFVIGSFGIGSLAERSGRLTGLEAASPCITTADSSPRKVQAGSEMYVCFDGKWHEVR